MSEHAAEFEMSIAARPETVFSLFVDHAAFAEWMGAQMGVATIDPRVGGAVRVEYGGGFKIASGEVLALEEPTRFSFTWGYEDGRPFAAGATRVDITLAAVGDGTLLTLRHSGLPSEVAAREHAGGWRLYTGILSDRAAKAEHVAGLEKVIAAWFAAWAEDDPEARLEQLRVCLADGGQFHHTMARATGREELSSHIASSRRHMQGVTFEQGGAHEQVQEHVRFPWRVMRQDGVQIASGENVFTLAPDGRIATLVGFTDAPA
jgi:uncharacterized protein YndB with AHSA1/START domain